MIKRSEFSLMIRLVRNIGEGCNMSKKLQNISGMSAEEVLERFGNKRELVADIFSIAQNMKIDVKMNDFTELEDGCGISKGTVLGCIIDDEENETLTILLQDKLPDTQYFHNMLDDEKLAILRRRQRFTVAHEIAHACLHLEAEEVKLKIDYNVDFSILKGMDKSEYEANVFAGELLIPKNSLIEVCQRLIEPTVDVLANIFDVSHSVMRERINYLKLTNIPER